MRSWCSPPWKPVSAENCGTGDSSRPAAAAACAVCGLSVLFLIPAAPRLVNLYGAFLDGYKLLIWLYLLECAVYGLWMNRDSAGLVLAGCLTMGACHGVQSSGQ